MRTVIRRKRCPQCGEAKNTELFNKNRAQADGLQTRCRKCENGVDEKRCLENGCDVVLHGYQKRCDEHRAHYEARKIAAAAATASRKAAAEAQRAADEEVRKSRRCAECGGPVPEHVKLDARYCGKGCRDAVNKRKQHDDHLASRKTVARSCEGCGADITERATQHPLATRCEDCQARHRSGRKRPKPVVRRLCGTCGVSINGRARDKTTCAEHDPKPPRWCVGCGVVDLRGTARWRCEECQAGWDAGESERVRQWQEDNPLETMLIRARSRAKRRGIECTITVEDIRAAWPEDSRCPVLGIELSRNTGSQHSAPESPSIDRINNTKGYVPGNVWVISVRANGLKRDFSIEELAAGKAGEHWKTWTVAYLAARKPSRRVVRRRAA